MITLRGSVRRAVSEVLRDRDGSALRLVDESDPADKHTRCSHVVQVNCLQCFYDWMLNSLSLTSSLTPSGARIQNPCPCENNPDGKTLRSQKPGSRLSHMRQTQSSRQDIMSAVHDSADHRCVSVEAYHVHITREVMVEGYQQPKQLLKPNQDAFTSQVSFICGSAETYQADIYSGYLKLQLHALQGHNPTSSVTQAHPKSKTLPSSPPPDDINSGEVS